ncbi:MAG: hypothetical protein NT069_22030 [Planctomycetota bacterium]|nr:hypothetical protein [Planctomycetota bacterium]
MTFTLNRDELQYGEFSSELVVFQKGKTAGDAETEVGRIPVNIKVRDSGPWPFVVLALGVAVGMFAGWYRLKGQARDQAQADVEQLDAFLEQPDVPEPFSDKVRELTVLARDALNKGELTKVSESVQQANGVVLQFNRARLAWLSVWKFCLDFRGALAEHKSIGTDTFGTKLATSLQTEFENIQGSFVESGSSPGKARQDLNPLLDKLNQYQQVCDDLRAFTKERELLTGAEADNWQQIYNQLSTRLGILGPADFGPNLGSLKAEIQAKLQELKSKTIAQAAAGEAAKESARAVPDNQWRQINHLAEYKSNWFRDRFDGVSGRFSLSRFRMRGYMLFGYAFPAMVFIYTGIQELYFKNAVFGTLDNYVGLFLSGFAADASGTKVQELIHQAGSRIEPREENKPADTPTPPKKP